MNNELILNLQHLENEMKRVALTMLSRDDDAESKKHAHELYGASETVRQWISVLEEGDNG
jgi:hypothetical protein